MLNSILNFIYPNVCGICEEICKENLCKKCENLIKKYEINLITKEKNVFFDENFYLFKYQDIIRKKIIEYKFQDKAYLYKTFSKMILKNKKMCGFFEKYDIIIPVPIHKKRKLKRGYNQTELIAKEISKKIGISLKSNILIKQKNIVAQSELNMKERRENIKGAFIVSEEKKIENKNILLFDDIYTTGSTANECSKVLKKAGANKIGVLTIAKD